jgi:hypothetical protein
MKYQETKDLIDVLGILKLGAKKDVVPMYSQYVNITEGRLTTCSEDIYINLNYEFPFDFEGCVNIFVFSDILKSINKVGVEIDMKVEDESLLISTKSYKTKIPFLSKDVLDFPNFEEIELNVGENSFIVSDNILSQLDTAKAFTGGDRYNYVVVDNKGICSTDTLRLFLHNKDIVLGEGVLIKLDKKIIQLLDSKSIVGVDENNNVCVKREDGFMLFTVGLEVYPIKKIREFSSKKIQDADNKICNFMVILESINKLTPVLFGESETVVDFVNTNNVFTIISDSQFNGTTKLDYKSESTEECSVRIDLKYLKNIPSSFDVFMKKDESGYLSLVDKNSNIIIIGEG